MTEQFPGSVDRPPLEDLLKLCEQFNAELEAGNHPRIETFLKRSDPAERDDLLRYLIALEVGWNQSAGHTPRAEPYRSRFPKHLTIVEDVFSGRDREIWKRWSESEDKPAWPTAQVFRPHLLQRLRQRSRTPLRLHERQTKQANPVDDTSDPTISGSAIQSIVTRHQTRNGVQTFGTFVDRVYREGLRDHTRREMIARLIDICREVAQQHQIGQTHGAIHPDAIVLQPGSHAYLTGWNFPTGSELPVTLDQSSDPRPATASMASPNLETTEQDRKKWEKRDRECLAALLIFTQRGHWVEPEQFKSATISDRGDSGTLDDEYEQDGLLRLGYRVLSLETDQSIESVEDLIQQLRDWLDRQEHRRIQDDNRTDESPWNRPVSERPVLVIALIVLVHLSIAILWSTLENHFYGSSKVGLNQHDLNHPSHE